MSLGLQIPDNKLSPSTPPPWAHRANQSIHYCKEHFTRHLARLHDQSPLSWHYHAFMLHPLSRFRRFWDTVLAFAVIYECWLIPFTLAMTWWTPSHPVEGLHISLDIFFVVDLLLNFRTAVVVYGELVQEPRDVAKIYVKSWFVVDFISVFPTDVVVAALFPDNSLSSTSTRGVKMLKYVKLPKLLRLSQLVRRFRRFQRYEGSLTILCAFVFVLHIAACIWIAVVSPCDEPLSRDLAAGFCNPNAVFDVYSLGVYYTVVMMTSMSLDVVFESDNPLCGRYRESSNSTAVIVPAATDPLPSALLALSTGYAIVGVILNSVVIGSSVFVVESWNRAGYQFRKRIDMINHEMEFLQLPEYLRMRIKAYHQYLWTHQGSATEKVTLLQDKGMSEPLRKEIAVFMYRDMLSKIPLFETASDQLLGFVCLCLTTVIFLPQDKIITRGEVGKDLFIVARGCVIVLAGDVVDDSTITKLTLKQKQQQSNISIVPPITRLSSVTASSKVVSASSSKYAQGNDGHGGDVVLLEGSFFGEMGLLMEVERTRTVVAGSICELGVLSKKDFTLVMKQFPSFANEIKRLVAERSHDPLTRRDTPTNPSGKRSMSRVKLTSLKANSAPPPLRRRSTLAALLNQHSYSRKQSATTTRARSTRTIRSTSSRFATSFPDLLHGTSATSEHLHRLDAKLDRMEKLLQELLARPPTTDTAFS
ncbi:hypothetical protein H257_07363 [Aphanomyces astaci]|uniref:Cyclic nucleotide-binding domain-containing protein n=1 Tax=Aphanomyces astaci TaxID=112090 RepID=W4GHX9_APHAT|nr:hypothetical protein H257_07363 [Aphanomyces astaci]ETV79325.1 hypothetical protein H257_07363 [Aphanomyces astaci]|eukprot:XP_009831166.1 hypothetical protein H257_07363 [Aphanomyces astaci]